MTNKKRFDFFPAAWRYTIFDRFAQSEFVVQCLAQVLDSNSQAE
ncbi:hypothetical protein [Chlorogloeopsis sp. ULAP02]